MKMYQIRAPFKFTFGLVKAVPYGTAIILQNTRNNEDDKCKTWQP